MSPPAAEGVPHGGMGEVRTEICRDRTHLLVHTLQFANKEYSLLS